MILVIMQMKVSAVKRKELSQTVSSLLGSIRGQRGCRRCDFFHLVDDDNDLCLLEEWDAQKNIDAYFSSEIFKVLRGALNLLEEPCEIICYQCLPPVGVQQGSCLEIGSENPQGRE